MYQDFLPLQKKVLAQGSSVIPGIPEAVAELRSRGMKIGSTTGYTRELMDVVIPIAASQGYQPDVVVCSDEVSHGRPAPWMNLLAATLLNVYPLNSIVVVDDTPVGIEAGKNAGMTTVAVSLTGNAMGLSETEVHAMPDAEIERRTNEIENAIHFGRRRSRDPICCRSALASRPAFATLNCETPVTLHPTLRRQIEFPKHCRNPHQCSHSLVTPTHRIERIDR